MATSQSDISPRQPTFVPSPVSISALSSPSSRTHRRPNTCDSRHTRKTMSTDLSTSHNGSENNQKMSHLETLVHARQTGYSAAEDMQHFLRHEPREKRHSPDKKSKSKSTGSGSKRSRKGIERVDCFVEPDGHQVIISPGYF